MLFAWDADADMNRRAVRWGAAAAAAVVLVSGGAYGYNNAYAYSYVTLDANPSIEYVLNRRNQIISVKALNDDAGQLAREPAMPGNGPAGMGALPRASRQDNRKRPGASSKSSGAIL